ncbi:MAG: CBS domain-containing protein [Candidatus Hodarchaeales archaeon]|jgi:CBS domain-containing protein
MKCPACGFKNIPGTSICENCSTALTLFEEKKPVTRSIIEKAILKDKLEKIGGEKSLALKVSPDLTVRQVVNLMLTEDKFSAVIMQDEIIQGIFTERSLLKRVCVESPINLDKPITEAMLRDPKKLKPEDCVVDALHMMDIGGFTYAIIDGDPLRVLNIRDILKYIIELEI